MFRRLFNAWRGRTTRLGNVIDFEEEDEFEQDSSYQPAQGRVSSDPFDVDVIVRYAEMRERFAYEARRRDHSSSMSSAASRHPERGRVESDRGRGRDDVIDAMHQLWEARVSIDGLCENLCTDLKEGLSAGDHAARLKQDGPHVLKPPVKPSWLIQLLGQFGNFFAVLLQVAAILCFVGFSLDIKSLERLYLGIGLYAVVVISCLFTFAQVYRRDLTRIKFRDYVPPFAIVKRDGWASEVDTSTLVVGDVVELQAGERIPADVRIVESTSFKVDTSILTGEKTPLPLTARWTSLNPLDTHNLAFLGTTAVQGTATAVVIATGDRTVLGRIASLTARSSPEAFLIETEIRRFILLVSLFAFSLASILFLVGILIGTPVVTNLIVSIGLILANIPEGLLPVVTLSLALSSRRMARRNVWVKKLGAVETLGSTTTICTDKTGTLTQGIMYLTHVMYDFQIYSAEESLHENALNSDHQCMKALIRAFGLCTSARFSSSRRKHNSPARHRIIGDPSETALFHFFDRFDDLKRVRASFPCIGGISFRSSLKFMVSLHEIAEDKGRKLLLMKGAPEKIIEYSGKVMCSDGSRDLNGSDINRILTHLDRLTRKGERVFGFAQLELTGDYINERYETETDLRNLPPDKFTLIGLVGLLDPPRATVPQAVRRCRDAGIQVIMITGDHPTTAKSIARQTNIMMYPTAEDIAYATNTSAGDVNASDVRSIVVTGDQLQDFEDGQWSFALSHEEVVFARTSPQQKLLIVENCQRLGKVVAVTGDGVNDSPALRKADIGIAMGITGTAVAQEASDMVLLDDNFASITSAIEEGRLALDNLKKSIAYNLSKSVAESLPFLLFMTASIPLPLKTVFVLCVDLGTDIWPSISLSYESAERDLMKIKPRIAAKEPLVDRNLLAFSYFHVGIIEGAAVLFAFLVTMNDYGLPPHSLLQLNRQGYFVTSNTNKKRWLVADRKGPGGAVAQVSWFDGDVGLFSPIPANISTKWTDLMPNPQNRTTGSIGFRSMVKFIGKDLGIAPCYAFECEVSGDQNQYSCFQDPKETINLYGINRGTWNSNWNESDGSGRCFDLWTFPEQQAVLTHAQVASFCSIVVVQIANLFAIRTRRKSLFHQRVRNIPLVVAPIVSLGIACAITYTSGIENLFGTDRLLPAHWLTPLPFATFLLVYDEVRKAWIRRGGLTGNGFGRWLEKFSAW